MMFFSYVECPKMPGPKIVDSRMNLGTRHRLVGRLNAPSPENRLPLPRRVAALEKAASLPNVSYWIYGVVATREESSNGKNVLVKVIISR